jgi:polysaccharide chain length determinant protein (PEP-CTERM system associated)
MTPDLRYYLSVLGRRLHYIALIFFAVLAVSVFVALKLPPVYQSTARLLMESAQIPDALAAPTVDTAALEQLQIIEQRLMTRTNLLDIARKFNVLPRMNEMAPDDIVTAMREATTITKQAGREQATLLTLTFDAENAQVAAGVVNEYVTRILTDSTASRTNQAQDTLQFFQQEVERLSADLSTQSARILEFQNQNADALPGTLNYRLTEQSNLQERLTGAQRDISGLKDQKQRLIEIYRSTGQLDTMRSTPQSAEAQQLAGLKAELSQLLAVLSPENPKVVLLRARVAELEAQVSAATTAVEAEEGAAGTQSTSDAPMTLLEIQTAEIDSQIARLTEETVDITEKLAVLTSSIERSAGVAVQLEALNRDYANLQAQYDSATDRLSKASTGERIAVLSKGQRIGVLDAATVPDTPARPNRTRIVLLGAMLGLALGFGLVGLLEMLNTSVRRPIDLERHLNIIPIGTIPYIRTPGEIWRLRLTMAFLILAILAGIPGGAWLIDTYYMPLDLVLAKVSTRLGF